MAAGSIFLIGPLRARLLARARARLGLRDILERIVLACRVVTRRALACLLPASLALVLRCAPTPSAQVVPGWNTQAVHARADRRRSRPPDARGRDRRRARQRPTPARSSSPTICELNTKTGELTASGNVVFQTPTARISADSVVFNTKTKLGTFNNASGIAQLGERGKRNRSMFGTLEPDVYFYGETIEKIGPDKYRITKGGFTTCVQPTPRWEIVSGSATLNLRRLRHAAATPSSR